MNDISTLARRWLRQAELGRGIRLSATETDLLNAIGIGEMLTAGPHHPLPRCCTGDAEVNELLKPTAKSEWTLAGALAAMWVLALVYTLLMAFVPWPDVVAPERILWLGRGMIGTLICNALIVIAFISPWVGTIKATGPDGVNLEVDGKD
jgi:hypothetical protein